MVNDKKISLVLCTINNDNCVKVLLNSLIEQSYNNYEVIIVDQNNDDRLLHIINKFSDLMSIKYIKSRPGLSYARNIGLQFVDGVIIGFPDDDCYYDKNTLIKISEFFKQQEYSGLITKVINSNPLGRTMLKGIKSKCVYKSDVFRLVHSISMFFRIDVIKTVGNFDERLGLGSNTIFNGHEDYDYAIRVLKKGYKIYFNNRINIFHPWDDIYIDKKKDIAANMYSGGASEMYILNKHEFSFWSKTHYFIRRIAVVIYFLLFKFDVYNATIRVNILKGMIKYWSYRDFQ